MKRRRTIEGMKVHRRVRILVLIMKGDEDFTVNENRQNGDTAKIDRKNDRLIHKHICALTITQTYTDRYFSKLILRCIFISTYPLYEHHCPHSVSVICE